MSRVTAHASARDAPGAGGTAARGQETPKRLGAIVDAAARVFAEKGYHGASTQDIADQLGIRQASLYYYFRSKDEALRLVCEKGAAGFLERAREILSGPENAGVRLRALIHSHMMPLQDRADYVRVFLRERQHLTRAGRNTIAPLARGVESCFEDVIRAGISAGEFAARTDPRLATLVILGALNAVPFWPNVRTGDLDRMAAQIADMMLDGLTVRRN